MKNIQKYDSFLNEKREKINQKDYTHYVVNVVDDKIWSGWEYKEDAEEMSVEEGEPFPRAKLKVYSKEFLIQKRLDPDKNKSWTSEKDKKIFR